MLSNNHNNDTDYYERNSNINANANNNKNDNVNNDINKQPWPQRVIVPIFITMMLIVMTAIRT